MKDTYDAVVVGSGPNGLSAAITLAQQGHSVVVFEARETVGGGTRTEELTLPGFLHDVCSAVHPMGIASPFFQSLPLRAHGLEWIHAPAALAHPFDDAPAALMTASLEETAEGLENDRAAYLRLFGPLVRNLEPLKSDILAPPHWPKHPFLMASLGLRALWPASVLARACFRTPQARALFAGLCGHSVIPLEYWASSAIGLVLGAAAHAGGWPIPKGGSQAIAHALASYFKSLGGTIVTGTTVASLDQLPPSRAVLLDVTPRQLLRIAGDRLGNGFFRKQLERFRYGPGIFKLDWALHEQIPWKDPRCAQAPTVHLGGTWEEIARSEHACWRNEHDSKPYLILVQPSLFDRSRTPEGRHTAWAYCHVPHGSTSDCTEAIERQVERFAPGFRDVILARSILNPQSLEQRNANLVGGDIGGGAATLRQLLLRPTHRWYGTPDPKLFLCSSSTPPGGGVHGMCGYHAAHAALAGALR